MTTRAFSTGDAPPYRPAPVEMRGPTTRLYRDFLASKKSTWTYFGPSFDDAPALEQLATQLQNRPYPREILVQILGESAAQAAAPVVARAQLDSLRSAESLVVFAGQQPGLFTGPLYTIYKALTVERWAADLSRQLATPVIPCFWLADDDHDFDEVNHIDVLSERQIMTLRYAPTKIPAGAPIGHIAVDCNIKAVFNKLSEYLPHSEFKPAVLDAVAECYTVGTRFSSAFARLWYRMFPRSRLLFIAPHHSRLYRLAAPQFQQAIDAAPRLFELYEETSRRLESDGYHRQAHKLPDQTLLFHQGVTREGIRRDGQGNFVWPGVTPLSRQQLCRAVAAQAQDFSPNVLLRPIIQNALFPTLGVVLGPSEVAYHAQLGALQDHFDVPRPAVLPRTCVTLMEAAVERLLSQHSIEPGRLGKDVELELARVLRARFPHDLDQELNTTARSIDAAFDPIRSAVERFDPALVRSVDAAATRARRELDQAARKLRAAHKRREREIESQVRSVALRLFPRGKPQERVFNILCYWAQHGPRFLSELYEHWPAGRRDPLIWELRSK